MTRKAGTLLIVGMVLALTPSIGYCQSDLGTVLASSAIQKTLKLGDLGASDKSWLRFRLPGETAAGASYLSMIYAMMGGTGDAGEFYTTGRILNIGDTPYLVAYTTEAKPIDIRALMRNPGAPPTPASLTADSPLSLALLNTRAITGMVGVQPFNLQDVLAQNKKQAGTIGRAFAIPTSATAQNVILSNAKQVMLGILQYAQDHKSTFPPMTSAAAFKKAIYAYVKSDEVFNDESGRPFQPNAALSRQPLSKFKSPQTTVAIYQATPQSDGRRVVGFADGHVKRLTEGAWRQLKASSHVP